MNKLNGKAINGPVEQRVMALSIELIHEATEICAFCVNDLTEEAQLDYIESFERALRILKEGTT